METILRKNKEGELEMRTAGVVIKGLGLREIGGKGILYVGNKGMVLNPIDDNTYEITPYRTEGSN